MLLLCMAVGAWKTSCGFVQECRDLGDLRPFKNTCFDGDVLLVGFEATGSLLILDEHLAGMLVAELDLATYPVKHMGWVSTCTHGLRTTATNGVHDCYGRREEKKQDRFAHSCRSCGAIPVSVYLTHPCPHCNLKRRLRSHT